MRLLALSVAIFAVAVAVSIATDQGGDATHKSNDVYRAVIGIGFSLSSVGTLITAAVAVIRDRERALLAYLAIALGVLAVAFVFGDIIFPN